jgi:hypothetical protein
MNDELQELRNGGYKPVLVGLQPSSLEEFCATSILHRMRRPSALRLPFMRIADR